MTEQQPKSKVAAWLGMHRASPFFVLLAGTAWQFANDGGRRGIGFRGATFVFARSVRREVGS